MDRRELKIIKAETCAQIGRYEDVMREMEDVIEKEGGCLTFEERNLYSVGCNQVIGKLQTAWKRLNEIEFKGQSSLVQHSHDSSAGKSTLHNQTQKLLGIVRPYKEEIESEIVLLATKVLKTVDSCLLRSVDPVLSENVGKIIDTCLEYGELGFESLEEYVNKSLNVPENLDEDSAESLVFLVKMIGDYRKYLAELHTDEDYRERSSQSVLTSYLCAAEIAKVHLRPTHPVRLGLALNWSVFYYEVLQQPERACALTKQAFDQAVGEQDAGSASSNRYEYAETSASIMKMMRDNLKQWTFD